MTLDDDMLRDLTVTCFHEFAHAEVAWHFGLRGNVRVFLRPDRGDEEKHFAGRFQLYGDGDPTARRLIGLAGEVAVEFYDDPTVESGEIFDRLASEYTELSATDAEFAGSYTEADIETCLQLVRELWPQIEWAANTEISLHKDAEEVEAREWGTAMTLERTQPATPSSATER